MASPKKPEIKEQRQQQILEAARVIFAQQGLAEARMDDVAQACGLSKGTLYLYYKNKDDLIGGLLEATFSGLLDELRALLDVDAPVGVRLMQLGAMSATAMQQDASTLNIAYEYYAVAARQPHIREFLQAYFAEYQRVLAALFTQGVERGEYAPLDAPQTALLLIALLEGTTLLWFTSPASVQLDMVLPNGIRHFLAGLPAKE